MFNRRMLGILIALTSAAAWAVAQGPPPGPPGGMGRSPHPMDDGGRGPGSRGGGPPSDLLSGKWWTSPPVIRRLGLSEDQQRRIEQIFQQNRLQLIDLRAALEKEEALLDPMLASEHPQELPVLAQIDRIASARAELEKANARMLFAFRLVLSPEQWKALQSRDGRGGMPPGRGRR